MWCTAITCQKSILKRFSDVLNILGGEEKPMTFYAKHTGKKGDNEQRSFSVSLGLIRNKDRRIKLKEASHCNTRLLLFGVLATTNFSQVMKGSKFSFKIKIAIK